MKTLIKNNSILIFIVFYFINISAIFCQSDNIEIKKIITNKKEYCAIPLDFQLSFSEKVDKVFNIQNIKKGVNITGNNRVIINTSAVYLKGEDSKVYFSPEKSETKISKAFQKLMNIKLDSTLQKLNSLNQRIAKWDSTLIQFATVLEKLPNNDPKKGKGIELLKNYKQNIETASCLNNDYGDKALIKKDKKGNTDYLFDIEIIKKDPNYIYVGESVNGFRVIKKRNKFGYLKDGENDFSKVIYKYDYAEDFHKSGFTFAYDRYNAYVVNNERKEIIRYNNNNNVRIFIINKNRFLVQSDKNDYIVDRQDKEIIRSNHRIKPADYTFKYFYVIDSLSAKEAKKIKFGTPLINNNEHITEVQQSDINKSNKKVLTRLFVCDIDGKNISKYFENDKRVLDWYKVKRYNLFKAYRRRDYDMIFLHQVFTIPNTEYAFYFFRKTTKLTAHFIIKNVKTDKIIKYDHINNEQKIAKNHQYYFYPLEPLKKEKTKQQTKDLVVGFSSFKYYWLNHGKKVYVPLEEYLLLKDSNDEFKSYEEATEYILNINQQRLIGGENNKGFYQLNGTLNGNKTIIVSKKDKDNRILKGAIDYNGLYIIPPFLKEMKYNSDGSFFNVITLKNDNVYELDNTGKCITGACKDYNKQIKEYFKNNPN